jgi:dienelactone hydrolase
MLETNRSIPVHILVPDEPGPHATLLALHGHGGDYLNGKSKVTAINGTRSGRGYGIELVLAGYVVVVPDLLGFGERDYVDQVRNGPWNQDIERFLYSAATIKGATLAGLNMFDMSHVIDAVLTLPEIDSGRLGVIGHSMGGTLAPMLMMYDGRLGVGVSSCGVSTWKAMLEAHVIHNYAVYAPDLGDGTDFDDLVAALAPRPFFMIAGESDPNTPVDGVKVVQDIATASYRRQHAEIAFQTRIRPGGHAFFPDDREAAARFLATHLPTGARSQ